jgi:3-phenylpropionate/cinnamic acid dioxygenase small subunit
MNTTAMNLGAMLAPPDELERPPAPALPTLAPAELCALLYLEAELLDSRRLEEWLALLTEDFTYWMPAECGQTDHEQRVSLYADDREIMEDRVWRLKHPKMFSQNPRAQQVRVLSNMIVVDQSVAGEITIRSKFIAFEHRLTEHRVFGGEYEHHLRQVGGAWRIARKIVRLANCEGVLWNIGVPL